MYTCTCSIINNIHYTMYYCTCSILLTYIILCTIVHVHCIYTTCTCTCSIYTIIHSIMCINNILHVYMYLMRG